MGRVAQIPLAAGGLLTPAPRSAARTGIGMSALTAADTEVTYWIDRSFWGQGIAGRALALLLESVRVRSLDARAASDNVRSSKCCKEQVSRS
jgi:RimJ/RimL family protein N-acetyltransferase